MESGPERDGRLREGALLFWKSMCGARPGCKLTLHGEYTAEAQFASCDSSLSEIKVESFPGPMGTFPAVVLRGSDLLVVEAKLPLRDVAGVLRASLPPAAAALPAAAPGSR